MDRRLVLAHGAALAAACLPLRAAPLIAQKPSARVIVDNDFAGDPDGLFALAHQWLSPTTKTVLVTTTALDAKLAAMAKEPAGRTAAKGRDAALELARVARISPCPVVTGAETFGASDAQVSVAARAIVAEALRDDPMPLFLTCGGPLTNVAAALRLAPQIAARMTVIWIGGSITQDGEPEYNFATDAAAARAVLAHPSLPLWVAPRETYRQLAVSVAELGAELRPASPLGRWLYERYLKLPPFVQLGPTVTLGDSALVHAAVLNRATPTHRARLEEAGRELPVVDRIDNRALLADLLAKLRLNATSTQP
ncbi:MAG TPA: nucleoside hydrolase [Roseateles sp.]